MSRALGSALQTVKLEPEDAATVQLARTYALQIDAEPWRADRLGPPLLSALIELGMTPKARNSVVKGGGSDDGSDSRERALNELEQRRERRRANAAPPVD